MSLQQPTVPIGPTLPTALGSNIAQGVPIAGVPGAGTPGVSTTSATNVLNPLPAQTTNNDSLIPTSNGLNLQDGSHTLVGDFKDTYGTGTGTALATILGGLGTSASNAITATNAQINQQGAITGANIDSSLAAAGISRDSSTSALTHGDFDSQLASTIATTDAGINLNEENTLISALQGEGAAHGTDSSGWDSFLNVVGDVGQIAGAVAPFII